MATEAQLLTALKNADAAGDTDAARKLAAAVLSARQQGGQQQTQDPQPQQQDERSFPRAIADVYGSFAGAVPKAAGAMVSIGSQVPVLNKVTDPVAKSLMNAGEWVDDALLSDYQKNMNADMANAIAKSAMQLGPDATISDHIDNMTSQGGASADFIMKNPGQALILTSQALPYLVGGGIIGRGIKMLLGRGIGAATAGAIGEGSIAAGAVTGDIIRQLEAEGIEGYTPDRLAALPAGVLTAIIGRMGAKVNQKLGGTDVDTLIAGGGTGSATRGLSPKGAVIGGAVELGEEFVQSAQEQAFTNIGTGDPISAEVGSSAVQGAVAGFGMGSVIGSNVFNRDGSPRNPTDLQIAQRAAAGDVARSLRKTAEDNEYNLGDIDPTSGFGAKQALEDYRRTQVTGIVNLVKSLKSQLNPKQAQTLEQLLQDYVPAEAGITASKRKVSAKVTTDQFDAVKRLVAGTQEGDTLLQELQKSNIVTDLFKDGMKGGVSKFTDLFNPLMTGGQSYDPTRVGNVVVGGLPLLSTGGASLVPQAAIVLGGQAIDKVLGGKGGTRRKSVERFIKLNEGNDGLGRPTGPSLIAQAQQAGRQEEQEAESSAALKEAVRRFRSERGGPEPDSAPLGMLYMGTGLDRSGLEQLLPHLEQHYGDRPEVTELINQTRRNLAGENNQITGLTDWISILNSVLSSDAAIDGLRISEPDGSDARNQRRSAGFGPSTAQASAGTSQQQPQGRSAAVQQGIDDNRAQLEKLRQGLAANTSLTPAERGRLLTALDTLEYNLGSDPAVAAMDVVSRLKSDGISESLINRHIMPYVERVLRQQARSGRQQPPSTSGTDLAFDEDFDASKPALAAETNPFNLSQNDLDATNVRIAATEAESAEMRADTFKPKKKRTLVDAAQYLQDRWEKATGRTTPFENTPENIDRLAAMMATEAYMALQKPNNAIGWYDRKIKAAKAIMSLIDPRITATTQNEHAFDFALAVTSNGVAVEMNFKYAHEVFEHYMNTGEMPASTFNKGGERNQAMVDAFVFFNAYQNSGRNYPLETFLSDEFTVRDLNEFVAEFNTQYGTSISVPSSEAIDAVVYGSFIFGPKIGQGFYQNIRGNYDPLTMDIWWMRMWNRFVGRPFLTTKDEGLMTERRKEIHTIMVEASKAKGNTLEKRIIAKSLKDLGETKRGLRGDKVRFDRVIERMHRNYQSYFAAHKKKHGVNHKKPKNYIFTKAKTYYENTVPQLQAMPASGERPYMRQVTKAAIAKLQEKGIDISTADMQALMWYPEKLLFRKLGVQKGQGSDNDYQDAAEILAKRKGITDAEIQRVLQAPRSDANRRDAFDSEPDTQGAYGRGNRQADRYGNSQQGQESIDQDLAQQGNTGVLATPPAPPQQQSPFNMKSLVNKMLGSQPATPDQVKAQLPFVRPAFEIGKAGTKYADGIQDIDAALQLSKALNVSVRLFDSQQEMFDDMGRPLTENARGIRGAYSDIGRTVWGMNAGAQAETLGDVNDLYALTTVLHELGHAVAKDSGFESVIERMMQDSSEYSDSVRKRVYKEIDNIQKNIDLYVENNPKQRRPVRRIMAALQARKNDPTQTPRVNRFLDYINQADERAVDPVLLYFVNPRLAKAVAPTTSQLVKENLNASGNSDLKLHAYPFATIVAVVLAMMLNGRAEEEEEEEQRQQMPAGALSPQAGSLSPQQAA